MKLFFAFICLLFSFTSFSQIDQFPSQQKGLLWKISGNGLSSPSYLFGTMHLMDSDLFLYPKTLDSIVQHSDQFILEIGALPDPFKTINLLTLNEGSFFDFFTKKEANYIFEWAEENLHMNEKLFRSMVDKWKPFAVIQLASQLAFEGETSSYEMKLYSISKEKQLPIIGLETVEQQIGFFDKLPEKYQTEMVLSALKPKASIVKEMNEMQSMYLNEHIDSLYLYISEQEVNSNFPTEQFLDNRNKKWMNILHSKLQENKNVFIAVGAGHLGGKNGLLRGLQEKGFIVSPILMHTLK